MNLEELRSVQRAERQKDSLQHLQDSFYEDLADYIAQLKDERQRAVAAAEDPFASEDVRRLTDTIETTTEIANALYERRVGKVVKHASFAAADMATDEDGMTTEERELFDDLVGRIRENRRSVLATLEGNGESPDVDAEASETEPTPTIDGAASADDATPMTPDRDGESGDVGSTPTGSTADDDLLSAALGDDGPTDEPDADPPGGPARAASDTASTERRGEEAEGVDVDLDPDSNADRPRGEAAAPSGDPEGPPRGGTSESVTPDAGREFDSDTDTDTTEPPDRGTDGAPDPDVTTERTTLRITADVGTVYGVDDREYDLAREDVVMLPTTNAEPLLRKNAAERID